MSISLILSFALTSLILALAPGPDNIFVLTNSALYGVRRGLAVIAGLCLGIMVQTACMIAGVTAFVSGMPVLLTVIKLAGAGYLLWLTLGATRATISLLRASRAPSESASAAADAAAAGTAAGDATAPAGRPEAADAAGPAGGGPAAATESLSMGRLVRRGFIMNITNPKVQLFFLSFFPQFLPSNAHGLELMAWMTLLGLIFTAATIIVFSAIAVFAGTLSAAFKSPRFNLILNSASALIFFSLAVYTLIAL